MYSDGIQPPTLNPNRVTFYEEPNGIYDTGATLVVVALEDAKYFISTGEKSNKIFFIPNSDTMLATEIMKLANEWRAPEYEVDIVPGVQPTLLSGVKFSDTDYLTVLDKEYINIY